MIYNYLKNNKMTLETFKQRLKEHIIEYSVRYNEAEKELNFICENQSEELEYFDGDDENMEYESNRLKNMDVEYESAKNVVNNLKKDLDFLFNVFDNIDQYHYDLIIESEFVENPIETLVKFGPSNLKTPYSHIRV